MYEASSGTHISLAIKECQDMLKENSHSNVMMRFNGIDIRVSLDSNIWDLMEIYDLKHQLRSYNLQN